MKNLKEMTYIEKISVSAAVVLSSAAFTTADPRPCTYNENLDDGNNFVVMELFTSEGCSSCPAADELIAKLQLETSELPHYILSYHVDYWDRLGWRDAFSDPLYTKRQRQYMQWHGGTQLYTPQLAVNGQSSCVGSDEASVRSLEKESARKRHVASLSVQGRRDGEKFGFTYRYLGDLSQVQLQVAVVQKHATTKVKRGENEGRTLNHVQVVRSLSTFNVSSNREVSDSINLPLGFNEQDWEIIALIQNIQYGEIMAATRVEVGA